jgi:tRNA(Ile)-lysidine synthase
VLSRVLGTIRDHALFERGDAVLVAVSGGPDSTALLHVLVELGPRLGITVRAATVDHGLRPEAADEAAQVVEHCRKLGVRCQCVVVDVGRAKRRHVSLQEAAREARLGALERLAAELGCNKVALGHTADDQAETVIFRIVRGTGIAGLAGIPYQRGVFVRPLLDVRRSELLRYLAKRKLAFVTDPSNADRHYARARVRHDLLPMLARENPRVVEALLGLAGDARAAPSRPWLRALPSDLYLPRRTLAMVDRLVARRQGTRSVAARGGAIVVRYGEVAWAARAAATGGDAAAAVAGPAAITGPGHYHTDGAAASAVSITRQASCPSEAGTACFDWAALTWPLSLRRPQPGDRMRPRGGRGSRKLSDLLVDAKIPRDQRADLPVLCDRNGDILFVPGLRPSELGRPGVGTRDFCAVRVAR